MQTLFLVARIVLGVYYLFNALNHFTMLGMMSGYVASKGVPAPGLAVIVAGLLLAWGGLLRGSMATACFLAAVCLAAVLPITVQAGTSGMADQRIWWPMMLSHHGLPVGPAYVCYHLTAGALPFVVLVLAADPSTTPRNRKGSLLFGLLLGTAAMLMRVVVGLPAAEYWALLLANTSVPLIDRLCGLPDDGTGRIE